MPKLGESVTEGTVERWLKAEGDLVRREEPLVEVVTDKVTAEMPSPVAGRLTKILVEPGQTVPANTPIALVEAGQAADGQAQGELALQAPAAPEAPAAPSQVAASAPGGAPRASGPSGDGRPLAALSREEVARQRSTPLVRRLAAEHGVRLEDVQGTGFGGRVRRDDLLAYLEHQSAPSPEQEDRTSLVPLTHVRRLIAERMTQSRQQVPDATTVFEVDMTAVVRRRAAVKEEFRQRTGVELTYLPFAIKAAVSALIACPAVNVSFAKEGLLAHRDVHIGIAVAVDGGTGPGQDALVVPVLRYADRLSIAGIARAAADLAARARANALKPEDLSGATFTVNNTGALGSIISTPIIPQPQAAIMTTEAIVKRPVVLTDADGNDSIAIRSMMFLCLSFDHRAFDGFTAGRFLGHVKRWLETSAATDGLY